MTNEELGGGTPVDEQLELEYRRLEVDLLKEDLKIRKEEFKEAKARAAVEVRDNERDKESRDTVLRDRQHHTMMIASNINSDLCRRGIELLEMWHRDDPGCDIRVIITSGGGEVEWGYALFDEIERLKNDGHRITTVIRGVAASMAGVIAQVGDHRVMGKRARLMIHQPSTGLFGRAEDIKIEAAYVDSVANEMVDLYMSRATDKITARQVKAKLEKGDWWLTAEEALRYGFIDEIA